MKNIPSSPSLKGYNENTDPIYLCDLIVALSNQDIGTSYGTYESGLGEKIRSNKDTLDTVSTSQKQDGEEDSLRLGEILLLLSNHTDTTFYTEQGIKSYQCGVQHQRRHFFQKSFEYFGWAVKFCPDNQEAYTHWAKALSQFAQVDKNGRFYRQARTIFEKVIAQNPKYSNLLSTLPSAKPSRALTHIQKVQKEVVNSLCTLQSKEV